MLRLCVWLLSAVTATTPDGGARDSAAGADARPEFVCQWIRRKRRERKSNADLFSGCLGNVVAPPATTLDERPRRHG